MTGAPPQDPAAAGTAGRAACPACGFPQRMLWPPDSRAPKLDVSEPGEFMYLGACPSCGGLWFSAAYEPYAAFSYLVSWGRSPAEWRRLYRRDNGRTLGRWQVARIRALYAQLGDEDRQAIARHRQRSFGRTPLDDAAYPEEGAPDLAALLSEPEDRD